MSLTSRAAYKEGVNIVKAKIEFMENLNILSLNIGWLAVKEALFTLVIPVL